MTKDQTWDRRQKNKKKMREGNMKIEQPRKEEKMLKHWGSRVKYGKVGLARLNHLSFFFFPFLSRLLFLFFFFLFSLFRQSNVCSRMFFLTEHSWGTDMSVSGRPGLCLKYTPPREAPIVRLTKVLRKV